MAELAALQDSVPPFSFDQVQTVLEGELGQRCAEVIDLEPEPLGAASPAQVHRASLRSGRQVVLKVQRPGLDRLFRLDLEVMLQGPLCCSGTPAGAWSRLAGDGTRVSSGLAAGAGFPSGAQYAARFRQQFLDDQRIRIPG